MVQLLLALLVFLPATANSAPKAKAKPPLTADVMAAAKPEDWRTPNPEDLLYLEIAQGRVVIELAPDYAPKHVARIKELAREKYWDGLAIVRVQDNYVVQWADPNSEKPELKRKPKTALDTIPAELDVDLASVKNVAFDLLPDKDIYASQTGFANGMAAGRDVKAKKAWLLHCYGAVGVGRDVKPESGDGTELYAVIGSAPRHLDRNVTVVGRILHGAEFVSSLPRGHGDLGFYTKDEKQVPIKHIRLASDVPEKERTNLEVLKTNTSLFAKYIEARRNRADEWFHYQANGIDACNISVPVREKKL